LYRRNVNVPDSSAASLCASITVMEASHGPIALLGLGEAGSAFAGDLVAAGVAVAGWDPAPGRSVPGLRRAQNAVDAIAEAELVLSLNSASVALAVAKSAAPSLAPGCLFADLNTAGVWLKQEVAEVVSSAGASFADVALLSPVPGRGIRTPSFASGDGAERYARIFRSFGAQVEVVGVEPGVAAARKLLRSVFMKGLAASVLESLAAAEAAGCAGWLRADIAATLRDADQSLVDRLVEGSAHHAVRRIAEMEAAAELLRELGVEPRVAQAAADVLRSLPHA
jgi:3-hydroxyisobutyrate dehydrogenase-like beta-hydroxyacid dehydrogenase